MIAAIGIAALSILEPITLQRASIFMSNSGITIVIADRSYTLRTDDQQGMRDMPTRDRDQLIALLEALKAQGDKALGDKSQRIAQAVLMRNAGGGAAGPAVAHKALNAQPTDRLGKGDVDAIMARLIMEERQRQKPGLQRATIYKFAVAIVVIIIFLSVL